MGVTKTQYFQKNREKDRLTEELYQELSEKDEVLEKAEKGLSKQVGTFRIRFNKKASENNTDIDYLMFLERLREDPNKLARGLKLDPKYLIDDVYVENFPRLRPLKRIRESDSSDESKARQQEIITILLEDQTVKALAERRNFWGLRSLYPFLDGVDDSEVNDGSYDSLNTLENKLKEKQRLVKRFGRSKNRNKIQKVQQTMTDLTTSFKFEEIKRAEELLQGGKSDKNESKSPSSSTKSKRRIPSKKKTRSRTK